MKPLIYLSIPILFLSSCGDDNASSDVQDSVRSRLPLFYEINSVKSETSEQNIFGKTVDVSQLAIDVTLSEDLYVNSRLSEDLQNQLNENNSTGFSRSYSSDKQFIKKVASKNDTKTIYGELMTTKLADGKSNIEDFNIKDAKGKPMSSFNKSEVIIVGSSEEKAYVDGILTKRAEAVKLKEEKAAKLMADKKMKEDAEKAQIASIAKARAEELAKTKAQILETFAEGKIYEGVYLVKTAEEVTVTISKFDAQFMHGSFEIKNKEKDFKTDIKFAFKLVTARTHEKTQSYKISGLNEPTGKLDRELTQTSALASQASFRYLRLDNYSNENDSIILTFGSRGKLKLRK